MKTSVGLTLVAAALLFGIGLVTVEKGGAAVVTTPFWQLHGAAPAAGETAAELQLRQAARSHAEPIVVAVRSAR
jgi:hypothetical protein